VRVALDTNILAYAENVNGPGRRDTALDLVRRLPQDTVVIPVQVLGELFSAWSTRPGNPGPMRVLLFLSGATHLRLSKHRPRS
jgi:predicted nucleic acid-binding protein